jgi:hypothetical protein
MLARETAIGHARRLFTHPVATGYRSYEFGSSALPARWMLGMGSAKPQELLLGFRVIAWPFSIRGPSKYFQVILVRRLIFC